MATILGIRSLSRPCRARGVVRCPSLMMQRCLNISPQPTTVFGKREEENLRPVGRHIPDSIVYHPTLFTLTTPSPDQLTKDEFFSSLQKAASAAPQSHRSVDESRTIVLLTTPSFATWIQDGNFMGRVVETLSNGYTALERVQTTTAVVDGLFMPTWKKDPGAVAPSTVASSSEGFSFMITSEDAGAVQHDSLKGLRDVYAEPSPGAGLRFCFMRKLSSRPAGLTEFIVPLANTLFRNGRKSTLLVTNWVKELPNRFAITSSQYGEAATVRTDGFGVRQNVKLPLDPLTKPRRIIAGLGNIIRQLEGDGGEALPASTELEESVVSYLTAKNLPQQHVSVWALVVTEEMMTAQRGLSDDPSVWDFIRQSDGGLHRVLSGGGGWGAKAGLLSLDPETTAPGSHQDDELAAFEERFANFNEQTQALGDIAKPGSYVWFFIAHEGLVDENGKLADLGSKEAHTRKDSDGCSVEIPTEQSDADDAYARIRLGCIRSTIDDVPAANSRAHPTGQDEECKMQLSPEFSAQSERALYARFRTFVDSPALDSEGPVKSHPSWPVLSVSKIDVPGTAFQAWHSSNTEDTTR